MRERKTERGRDRRRRRRREKQNAAGERDRERRIYVLSACNEAASRERHTIIHLDREEGDHNCMHWRPPTQRKPDPQSQSQICNMKGAH